MTQHSLKYDDEGYVEDKIVVINSRLWQTGNPVAYTIGSPVRTVQWKVKKFKSASGGMISDDTFRFTLEGENENREFVLRIKKIKQVEAAKAFPNFGKLDLSGQSSYSWNSGVIESQNKTRKRSYLADSDNEAAPIAPARGNLR